MLSSATRKEYFAVAIALGLFALATSVAANAQDYTLTPLPPLASPLEPNALPTSFALGINDAGQVAGYGTTSNPGLAIKRLRGTLALRTLSVSSRAELLRRMTALLLALTIVDRS